MKLFGLEIRKAATKIDPPFDLVWTKAGFVTQNNDPAALLREGFNMNSTIYGMIATMYNKFSSIPWILYKVKSGTKANQYKALTGGYNDKGLLQRMKLKASAFDEVTGENEMQTLWDRPNTYQTGQQFREQLLLFLKATGAAPIYVNKGLSGSKPLSLHSLPSQFIQLRPDGSLQTYDQACYTITGEYKEIPLDQFYYWKYPNPNYSVTGAHIYGLSPLKAGAKVICADNENIDAMAFTFKNKGATGIFTPKDAAGASVGEKNKDSLRDAVDVRANSREYGKARTYINMPMDLHTFGMTAQEMESIAAHIQNKENLANLFNFPPLLMQMAKGNDARYENAIKYLITNTIYPDLTGMRSILNEWIVPMFGFNAGEYFWDFDLSAMPELQEDMEKLVNSAIKMIDAGMISRNEARNIIKFDEHTDPLMNEITTTTNVQPLSAAFEVSDNIDPEIM